MLGARFGVRVPVLIGRLLDYMNAASSHRSPVKRGMGLMASFLLGVAVTTFAHRMPWDAHEVIADAEPSPRPPRAAEPSPQQSAQPPHEAAAAAAEPPSAAVEREAPEQEPAAASSREPVASGTAHLERAAARPSTPERGKAGKAAARTPAPQGARKPEAQAEPERKQTADEQTADEQTAERNTRAKASPAISQEPVAAERPANENEMDRLLERALDDASGGGSGSDVPTEELPAVPSKQDIAKAVSVLFPAVQGCAQGKSGMAVVDLVVRNDGRVVSAEVSGHPFEGTAAARCIAGVIRRARFPRFAKPSFRVRYPLSIRP